VLKVAIKGERGCDKSYLAFYEPTILFDSHEGFLPQKLPPAASIVHNTTKGNAG